MDYYILDYLVDHLLYTSGNKIVDDFIRSAQIKGGRKDNMMEFVPYNQFKNIEYIAKFESFKATWIDGSICYLSYSNMKFKRSGHMAVTLKKLNSSENITSKELNEVHII